MTSLSLAPLHRSPLHSVLRYEVNFQSGIDCGGAYIKLLSQTPDLDLVSSPAHTSIAHLHFVLLARTSRTLCL